MAFVQVEGSYNLGHCLASYSPVTPEPWAPLCVPEEFWTLMKWFVQRIMKAEEEAAATTHRDGHNKHALQLEDANIPPKSG